MLRYLVATLRASFWFVPSVMAVASIVLAYVMVQVDTADWARGVRLWAAVGVDGSRQVMSTIAGAMMTAASLVYSMTLVALTLAAQSAGQRLLQELMGNRAMQVSLGLFLATFIYALLVLRAIAGGEAGDVPNLSVAVAIGLAILSFAWLIYFIHSLAESMQTHTIVADVAAQLVVALRTRLQRGEPQPVEPPPGPGAVICVTATGYVEMVDEDRILSAACRHDARVHMRVRPGHFVIAGDALAELWGGDAAAERMRDAVRGAVMIGPRRTAAGDPEYLVHLNVEIALRALSPGINDSYTAMACLDHLAGAFAEALACGLRSPQRADDSGRVRLELYPTSLADLIRAAFDPIREASAANLPVGLRVLEALARMRARCRDDAAGGEILRQAELAATALRLHVETEADGAAVDAGYQRVFAAGRTRDADPRPAARSSATSAARSAGSSAGRSTGPAV
jgi:uncharacterized membrane protein